MLVERNMPHLWKYLVGLLAIIAAVPVAAEPAVSVVRSTDGTDLLVAQEGDPNAPGILMIHGFAQRKARVGEIESAEIILEFTLFGPSQAIEAVVTVHPGALVDIRRLGDVHRGPIAVGIVAVFELLFGDGAVGVGEIQTRLGPA